MLETPFVTETSEVSTATLHLIIPRSEIQTVMGPALGEVFAAMAAQGIEPSGPWFTHHRRRPTDTFDFEICVPVARAIAGSGRVVPGVLPARRVARVLYRGPYEGLGAAWGEFVAWVAAQGLKPANDLWERYLTGPETGLDSSTYVTELNQPLVADPGTEG